VTTEAQALYDWLKKNWRQNDHKRIKYLASMSLSGGRVLRWPVVLLLLLVVGCGPLNVGPTKPVKPKPVKPLPVETIEQAAASSLAKYHERLASAFETLASEIEQGGIEDDEDLANRMEELTKTARLGSFEAFRTAWAKAAGADSPWESRQRAAICRETARGFAR